MWIARDEYVRLSSQRFELISKDNTITDLKARLASQQATLEWLMMRLTQLEHERAKLVETYMGVKIPVPEIGTPAPTDTIDQVLRDPGALFQDVGDEEAARQGIGWDDSGRIRYNNGK